MKLNWIGWCREFNKLKVGLPTLSAKKFCKSTLDGIVNAVYKNSMQKSQSLLLTACISPKFLAGIPYCVVAKVLDCDIIVSEFKLQSHYHILFWSNTLLSFWPIS